MQYQHSLNFVDVSIFFAKYRHYSGINSTFTQSRSARAVLKRFLVLFSDFARKEVTINENVNFTDYAFEIRLPDCSKLAINWKNGNDVTIFWNGVIVKFYWQCFVSLVKLSYWFKFHINIMTGSGVMTILFFKGVTRNPTPVSVLPNIWRLGLVRDTRFGTNAPSKVLLNVAKCKANSFYRFWNIKGKPTGRGELHRPPRHSSPPTRVKPFTNNKRDRLSSWKILLWIFNLVSFSFPDIKIVCQLCILLDKRWDMSSATSHIFMDFLIQEWGIIS